MRYFYFIINTFKKLRWLLPMLLLLSFATGRTTATDLTVKNIQLQRALLNQYIVAYFVIANINMLPAINYYNMVTIRRRGSSQPLYQTEIEGKAIQPYTEKEYTEEIKWTPTEAGDYSIDVQVYFDEDIDNSNDKMTYDFSITNPVLLPFIYTLYQLNLIYDTPWIHSPMGMLFIRYHAQKWGFLNAWAARSKGSDPVQIVDNAPLPEFQDSAKINVWVDLGPLLKMPDSTKLDSVYILTTFSDLMDTTKNYNWDDAVKIPVNELNYEFSDSYLDTTSITTVGNQVTVPVTNTALVDSVYRGCNVPNLDLDSSQHPPSSTYAGDKNACAPTGAANSMQWLENMHPEIESGLTHRGMLEELSRLMNREDNTGVWLTEFIKGKLAYIDKYKLPIRVKFQTRGSSLDVSSPSEYDNTAENKGEGGYPTWDFLMQEMKDSEDVEIFVEIHKTTSATDEIIGRHVVTATGAAKSGNDKTIWYKDDYWQSIAGGTMETTCTFDTTSNGTPVLRDKGNIWNKNIYYVPYAVVSESYDSTVQFKEKGIFDHIQNGGRSFVHWLFKPDLSGEAEGFDIYNIVARDPQTGQNYWLLKNYIIPEGFGLNSSGLIFDLSSIPFINSNTNTLLLATEVDNNLWTQITSLPDNEFFDYNFSSKNYVAENSIVEPDNFVLPNLLDFTYDYSVPTNNLSLSDTVFFRNFMAIDLNQGLYNSNSVQGYSGDLGAAGPASIAAILDYLDLNHNEFELNQDLRQSLYELSGMMNKSEGNNVLRTDLVEGLLDYIDKYQIPIAVEFQSRRLGEEDILSPNTSFGHKALNQNDEAFNAPQWDYLLNEANDGNMILLELAYYDSLERKQSLWVTVEAMMNMNGHRRFYISSDSRQDTAGGKFSGFYTWAETVDGVAFIPELSFGARGYVIESAVSIGYDPTIVFTDVEDDLASAGAYLKLVPNPVSATFKSATLEYYLPESGEIKIEVFDVLGNLIGIIEEGNFNKGYFSKSLSFNNFMDISTGVYYVKLKGKSFMAAVKLIIN